MPRPGAAGFSLGSIPAPLSLPPLSNIRDTKAQELDKFLTTDKDWDTSAWTNTDLAIASDVLVKACLTDNSRLRDARRGVAVYLLGVLLKRHPEFMLPYLERLCDDMLARGLRMPNNNLIAPDPVAIRLLTSLAPMMVCAHLYSCMC